MKVLVTEKLSDAGLDLLRKDFEVDVRPSSPSPAWPSIAPTTRSWSARRRR
jgi:hypothetical protein